MSAILATAAAVMAVALLGVDRPGAAARSDAPFALVELFTSEGCSSCPPAEKYAGELVAKAEKEGSRVFVLAFHVDYWDYIGWKDRMASPANTERQRRYQRALGERSIYTPQMIVNGTDGFVGSDRSAGDPRIAAALKKDAACGVEVKVSRAADDGGAAGRTIVVAYELSRAPEGSVVNVALVERGITSEVTAGENRGKTLSHDNVVRLFETVKVPGAHKGESRLSLPEGAASDRCSVIVYVQDEKTMAVLGAGGARVPRAERATTSE